MPIVVLPQKPHLYVMAPFSLLEYAAEYFGGSPIVKMEVIRGEIWPCLLQHHLGNPEAEFVSRNSWMAALTDASKSLNSVVTELNQDYNRADTQHPGNEHYLNEQLHCLNLDR